MEETIRQVKFDLEKHPKMFFDFLHLEELFSRKDMDHNPESLHRVSFFILMVITEGEGEHTIDFKKYAYQKGTVLTIRKDQVHQFHKSQSNGYILIFTDDFLQRYLEKLEAIKNLQLFNELIGSPKLQLNELEFIEVEHLVKEVKKEFFNKKDEYSQGIIRSFIHILISRLYRIKSNYQPVVRDKRYLEKFIHFQELVEQNCFTTKTVKDYSDQMGITSKTLNNIVKRIVRKSAKIFIDEIVVTQIKRLLVHTSLSVKEIAYQAGFDEPSNLFKYFKKYVQITPEEFRSKYA